MLTPSEALQLRAATLFSLPVPRPALEAAGAAAGVAGPERALDRLEGLGLVDLYVFADETAEAAVDPLARPLVDAARRGRSGASGEGGGAAAVGRVEERARGIARRSPRSRAGPAGAARRGARGDPQCGGARRRTVPLRSRSRCRSGAPAGLGGGGGAGPAGSGAGPASAAARRGVRRTPRRWRRPGSLSAAWARRSRAASRGRAPCSSTPTPRG